MLFGFSEKRPLSRVAYCEWAESPWPENSDTAAKKELGASGALSPHIRATPGSDPAGRPPEHSGLPRAHQEHLHELVSPTPQTVCG